MFGKVMSVSDALMWTYYTLLTDRSQAEIDALRREVEVGSVHPKAAKVALATSIVTDFHGAEAASGAAEAFDRVFSRGELPEDLAEVVVLAGIPVEKVLVAAGLAIGTDAHRKVAGRGADQRRRLCRRGWWRSSRMWCR
jgi:tyrosyl-tRNA synthetase